MSGSDLICLFDGYGCRILSDGTGLLISYESGESAGSKLMSHAISRPEADLAMQGEYQAYRVIMAARRRNGLT